MSIVSSISKTLAGNLGGAGTKAIGSGLLWGGLAAAGTAGYNAATGESGGVGTAFALGAIGMGGRKYFSKLNKGAGAGNWGKSFKKSGGFGGLMARLDRSGGSSRRVAEGYFGESKNAFLSKNAKMLGRYAGGAHSGAIAGAVIGAGYGVFSDHESMMSGAFKGAVLGGVAGGIYRGAFKKKFTNISSARNTTAGGALKQAASATVASKPMTSSEMIASVQKRMASGEFNATTKAGEKMKRTPKNPLPHYNDWRSKTKYSKHTIGGKMVPTVPDRGVSYDSLAQSFLRREI